MTLKDKLKVEIMDLPIMDEVIDDIGKNLEDVADFFAIGFAEWCTKYRDKNRNVNGEMLHAKSKYDETYLTKELLEMYKKENGL